MIVRTSPKIRAADDVGARLPAGEDRGATVTSAASGVVATVAGEPITLARLEERVGELRRGRIGRHMPPDSTGAGERFRRWIVQDLVRREVLVRAARGLGLLGPADRRLTARVLEALIAQVTANVSVPEAESRAYYQRNPDLYWRPESRRIRYAVARSEVEARDVASDLRSGGESAVRELPELRRGQLVGPLEDAVFEAAVGEVVGPIELDGAWWIARVEAVAQSSLVPFERVRASIEETLLAEARKRAFEEWLEVQRQELVRIAPAFEHPGHPIHGLPHHRH